MNKVWILRNPTFTMDILCTIPIMYIYLHVYMYIYIFIYTDTYTCTCFCKYIRFKAELSWILRKISSSVPFLRIPNIPDARWEHQRSFLSNPPKHIFMTPPKIRHFYMAQASFSVTNRCFWCWFFSPFTSRNSNNSYPQIPCQGASCATDCQSGWGALGSSACVNDWQLTQQAMQKGKGGGYCKWLGWECGNVKGLMG